MYNALILPHINYGLLLWGHQAHRIFKLQKKAIRIISLSKYNAHTSPIFKRLQLLKLDDIYKIQQLKCYYKLINNLLPYYFNVFPNTHIYDIHQHCTRERNNLYMSRFKHEFAKKCIRHNIVETVNNTPSIIINKIYTHSLYGFSTYTTNFLILNYESCCRIHNCFICNS